MTISAEQLRERTLPRIKLTQDFDDELEAMKVKSTDVAVDPIVNFTTAISWMTTDADMSFTEFIVPPRQTVYLAVEGSGSVDFDNLINKLEQGTFSKKGGTLYLFKIFNASATATPSLVLSDFMGGNNVAQKITITEATKTDPIALEADTGFLELTLAADLTSDAKPSDWTGWILGREYTIHIVNKSSYLFDASDCVAANHLGYDDNKNPFTALSEITSLQQRAHFGAVGMVDYGQMGGMIITGSNYIEVAGLSAPGVPTSAAAVVNGLNIDCSWVAPLDNGGSAITGYKIEHKLDAGSWGDLVADTGDTNLTYEHTAPGSGLHTYRYSAINVIDTGSASAEASDTMVLVPEAPTSLVATFNTPHNDLVWVAPASGDAPTGYKIESELDAGGFSTLVANTGNTDVTYEHSNPVDGTHNYRVYGINSAGQGAVSNEDDAVVTGGGSPSAAELLDGTGWDTNNPAQPYYMSKPEGYDDNSNDYPLIVYMGGTGSQGTSLATLRVEGAAKYCYEGDLPDNVLLGCPQLYGAANEWFATQINFFIDYAIANYRVDENRIYLTGLSLGGSGLMKYMKASTANANKIAAVYVASGAKEGTWNGANIEHVALWWHHGCGDTTYNISNMRDVMVDLNGRTMKTIPKATDYAIGHSSTVWHTHVYNRGTAKYDYVEWLLLHSLDDEERATNYTTYAENNVHWHTYYDAARQVAQVGAGAPKTALEARLAALWSTLTNGGVDKVYFIDFGSSSYQASGNINNLTSSAAGAKVEDLVDIDGGASSKLFTIVNKLSWGDRALQDIESNNNYFGAPDDVYRDVLELYHQYSDSLMKYGGLDNGKTYDLLLYGNNTALTNFGSENMDVEVTIGGVDKSARWRYGNTEFIEFNDIAPSATEISMLIDGPPSGNPSSGLAFGVLVEHN